MILLVEVGMIQNCTITYRSLAMIFHSCTGIMAPKRDGGNKSFIYYLGSYKREKVMCTINH